MKTKNEILKIGKNRKKQSYGTQWVRFLPKDITLERVDNVDCLNQYLETKYYSTNRIKDMYEKPILVSMWYNPSNGI